MMRANTYSSRTSSVLVVPSLPRAYLHPLRSTSNSTLQRLSVARSFHNGAMSDIYFRKMGYVKALDAGSGRATVTTALSARIADEMRTDT